ncbi:MAG: hypothetical protein L6R19_02045 [Alphaproteobacteria bacterium]|nr:hypothetical protein [Alphaproteobacteria bacterium]
MRRALLPLIGALILGTLYAGTFGFLSTDSWTYLAIARSLRIEGACALDGAYVALFPCGYPAAIALFSWSADEIALIAGSKLANLIAWIAAAALMQAYARHWPATLVFVLNPVSLLLLFATWSESLMLLAVAGALFAVRRSAERPEARWSNALLLAGFLVLGAATRHFFGPFLAVFALAVALCCGREAARRILPGLIASVLFLGAYQAFNLLQTGFATGAPRVAAPEPATALTVAFLRYAGRAAIDFAGLIVTVAVATGLATAKWPMRWRVSPEPKLLVALGIGYLALAYLLRLLVLFDPFGPRTVGPGIVLVSTGMAALILPASLPERWTRSVATTAAALAWSLVALIGPRELAAQAGHIARGRDLPFAGPAKAIAAYGARAIPPGTTAVVVFRYEGFPPPLRMAPSIRRAYPPGIARIGHPGPHDSIDSFVARLDVEAPGAGCQLDFTPFASDEDLRRHARAAFSPEVADRMAAIGRPGRFVPCAAFRQTQGQ